MSAGELFPPNQVSFNFLFQRGLTRGLSTPPQHDFRMLPHREDKVEEGQTKASKGKAHPKPVGGATKFSPVEYRGS